MRKISNKIFDIYGVINIQNNATKIINNIGKSAAQLVTNMTKATSSVTAFATTAAASFAAVGAAVVAVSTVLASNFEEGLDRVGTLLDGDVDEKLKQFGDQLKDLSVEANLSTNLLTDGLYEVVSAVGDVSDSMGILEVASRAAKAGQSNVIDSVKILSAVMKGYGDVSEESAARTSDLIFQTVKLGQTTFPELANTIGKVIPLAASLKVSQEELFGVMATLTGVTGSAAEVTTQLRGVMAALVKPTDAMEATLEKLGYTSGLTAARQEGLVDLLEMLYEAVGRNDQELIQLFGRIEATNAVLALTGSQADVVREKTDKMTKSVGSTDKAFEQMNSNLKASVSRLKNYATQLLITVGQPFESAFAKFVNSVIDNIPKVEKMFKNLTLTVLKTGKVILAMFRELVVNNQEWINEMHAAFTVIKEKIKILVEDAITYWKPKLTKVWKEIKDDLIVIWGALWDTFGVIIKRMTPIILSAVSLLTNLISLDFGEAYKDIKEIWENVGLMLKEVASIWWNVLDPTIQQFILDVVDGMKELYDWGKEIGTYLITGFIDGVTENFTKVKNVVTELGTFIIDAFKGELDIHSPSRVFSQMGMWTVAGYVTGIVENTDKATKAAKDLANGTLESFQDEMGIASDSKKMKENGKWTVSGYAAGIVANIDKMDASLDAMIVEVEQWGQDATDLAYKTGKDTSDKMAEGMDDGKKTIKEVLTDIQADVKLKWKKYEELITTVTDNMGGQWSKGLDTMTMSADIATKAISGDYAGMAVSIINNGGEIAENIGSILGITRKDHKFSADYAAKVWEDAYKQIGDATIEITQNVGTTITDSITETISQFEKKIKTTMGGLVETISFGLIKGKTRKSLDQFSQIAVMTFEEVSDDLSKIFIDIENSGGSTFDKISDTMSATMDVTRESIQTAYNWMNRQLEATNNANRDKAIRQNRDVWRSFVDNIKDTVKEIEPFLEQLTGIAISDADKLGRAIEDALESKFDSQESAATDSINKMENLTDEQREFEIRKTREHFDNLRQAENIEQEALLLAQEGYQKNIISLLEEFNPEWQNAGQSFGEKFVEGLNSTKKSITDEVNDILGQVKELDVIKAEIDVSKKAIELGETAGAVIGSGLDFEQSGQAPATYFQRQGSPTEGAGSFKGTNIINQYFNIVNPSSSDVAEIARQSKNKIQDEMLGVV